MYWPAGDSPRPGGRCRSRRDRAAGGGGTLAGSAGPQATRENVRLNLAATLWAHFACHGYSGQVHPSDSHLSLRDGPLTVSEIAGMRLDHAEFAFLSACSTASGSDRLPDEAIHIAAALQLTGYTHVIGTLWPIPDTLAPRIARHVYQNLEDDLSQAAPQVRIWPAAHDSRRLFPLLALRVVVADLSLSSLN
jgi:hypothetical protein